MSRRSFLTSSTWSFTATNIFLLFSLSIPSSFLYCIPDLSSPPIIFLSLSLSPSSDLCVLLPCSPLSHSLSFALSLLVRYKVLFLTQVFWGIVSPGVICPTEQVPHFQRNKPGQSEFSLHPPLHRHIPAFLFCHILFSYLSVWFGLTLLGIQINSFFRVSNTDNSICTDLFGDFVCLSMFSRTCAQ